MDVIKFADKIYKQDIQEVLDNVPGKEDRMKVARQMINDWMDFIVVWGSEDKAK